MHYRGTGGRELLLSDQALCHDLLRARGRGSRRLSREFWEMVV